MKYFDVLSVCHWTEAGCTGWYFVHTIEARSGADAIRKVARKMPGWFYAQGRELQHHRICGAGDPGAYDQFIGKYEGEFIDTHLGVK